jgi:glycogen synthase
MRPQHADAVTKWYDDVVIPAARRTGGLKGAILLINRQTGKGIGIGFWESKQNADAYEATGALHRTLQKLKDRGVSFTAPPVRTEYTVEHADMEFTVP